MTAQKALQVFEAETRKLMGGTKENNISPIRGHWFVLQANKPCFKKPSTIALDGRPGHFLISLHSSEKAY